MIDKFFSMSDAEIMCPDWLMEYLKKKEEEDMQGNKRFIKRMNNLNKLGYVR